MSYYIMYAYYTNPWTTLKFYREIHKEITSHITYLPCTFCSSTPWCARNFSLILSKAKSTAGPHLSRSKGESRREAMRTPTLYTTWVDAELDKTGTKTRSQDIWNNIFVDFDTLALQTTYLCVTIVLWEKKL